jgi:cytoskeleton-associated protein 5
LREDFGEANCKELMPTLVLKFMEKKTQIIEEVHVVLGAFCDCVSMEPLVTDIAAAIIHKAPTVKKNICVYLEKLAQVTYIDVLQRCSNELILALMKSSEDMAGDVRDAALSCIGIFKGRLGESSMSKYLSDLNP